MTFKGKAASDLHLILSRFPISFTTREVMEHCQLPKNRIAQAIVYGKQEDVIHQSKEVLNPEKDHLEAVYEVAAYRQKWLKYPWRSHGTLASRSEA